MEKKKGMRPPTVPPTYTPFDRRKSDEISIADLPPRPGTASEKSKSSSVSRHCLSNFSNLSYQAPDVDAAYFNLQLPKLKTLTKELNIFYHKKDLFLRYSAFKHKGKRLGQFADNQGDTAIKTFDCTNFKNTTIAGKFSRHLYYKTSVETKKIIKSLL